MKPRQLFTKHIAVDQHQHPLTIDGWIDADGTTYLVLSVGGKRSMATKLSPDLVDDFTRTLQSVKTML